MAEAVYNLNAEEEKALVLNEYKTLIDNIKYEISPEDQQMMDKAFEIAEEAHKTMRRKSGEPYILHPIAVARIASEEIGLSPVSIVCALLHDVVEDTEWTLEDIEQALNSQVAEIVDGLTKISSVFDLKSSLQAENFRKLLLTLAKDVRVILIKIADRLHNMRTMNSMPRHKQLKIASETSYLYAPMAHRLGLYAIKTELEDLSLKYSDPQPYKAIAQKLKATKKDRSKYIKEFCEPLQAVLDENGFDCRVFGRAKSIFSIHNKMTTKGVEFEEVYDLFAIRIVIRSEKAMEKADCWRAYSIATDFYRPNPERLRDWISTPKANGYESLHTTVMGPAGRWVEVQIRTERMDEIAERGFAAHWKYKEGSEDSGLDSWIERIREVLSNPEANALDFINDFKLNLFEDEIYVFTPKGDLIRLPTGATILDFAYEIHTAVGDKCIGAKLGHKLVPLNHVLNNGDQVEILTSKKQEPNEDWLGQVVTGRARSKIKYALNEKRRKVAEMGKEILERKLNQLKVEMNEQNVLVLCDFYKIPVPQDLYVRISKKLIDLKEIKNLRNRHNKLEIPKKKIETKAPEANQEDQFRTALRNKEELLIFGESSKKINYSFATCCNPIAGDDVFGFIAMSGEIKIHRVSCPNAINLMSKYGYRIVRTRWTNQEEPAFLTGLLITGIDDMGVMNVITKVISKQMKINMRSISFDSFDGLFEGRIKLFVNDIEELAALIVQIKDLEGIHSVKRMDTE